MSSAFIPKGHGAAAQRPAGGHPVGEVSGDEPGQARAKYDTTGGPGHLAWVLDPPARSEPDP